MLELSVSWQAKIILDNVPEGESNDPFRSEYGNLYGFCSDPRLGHKIVVVKVFSPWTGSELDPNDSFVFRAIPNLSNDELSGQMLSINGYTFPGTIIASNQNPFRPWADVAPDDNGNIPTCDLLFSGREYVDRISDELGVPKRG